jgi:hypothetical protein
VLFTTFPICQRTSLYPLLFRRRKDLDDVLIANQQASLPTPYFNKKPKNSLFAERWTLDA